MDFILNPRPQDGAFKDPIQLSRRDLLIVPKPYRPIDARKVSEMADSIRKIGVLNPITTTYPGKDGKRTLIAGWHRWAAMCEVWDSLAPEEAVAFVMPTHCVILLEEHREVLTLAENLMRNDLSIEQRKGMALRYLELLRRVNDPTGPGDPTGENDPARKVTEPSWFNDWFTKTGIDKKTAQRMWTQYTDATGVKATPAKASAKERDGFAPWYRAKRAADAKAKADAANGEAQAKADAKLAAAQAAWDKAGKTFLAAMHAAKKAGVDVAPALDALLLESETSET